MLYGVNKLCIAIFNLLWSINTGRLKKNTLRSCHDVTEKLRVFQWGSKFITGLCILGVTGK